MPPLEPHQLKLVVDIVTVTAITTGVYSLIALSLLPQVRNPSLYQKEWDTRLRAKFLLHRDGHKYVQPSDPGFRAMDFRDLVLFPISVNYTVPFRTRRIAHDLLFPVESLQRRDWSINDIVWGTPPPVAPTAENIEAHKAKLMRELQDALK